MPILALLLACGGDPVTGHEYTDIDVSDVDADTDADADTDTDADTDSDTDADTVQLAFVGTIVTVSGTPFGFDASVRESAVSGWFRYDLRTADTDTEEPRRGTYPHTGGGGFELLVGGRTVAGTWRPVVEVENFDADTFRFVDGADIFEDPPRVMTLDGIADGTIGTWLAITDGTGAAFPDDTLPDPFPMLAISTYPHTFSVSDAAGTLLLQLSALSAADD